MRINLVKKKYLKALIIHFQNFPPPLSVFQVGLLSDWPEPGQFPYPVLGLGIGK